MRTLLVHNSAALQTLQAARPAQSASAAVLAAPKCLHPTKPVALRTVSGFDEPCVELLVASTSSGSPCCILPTAQNIAHGTQTSGLFRLISLQGLSELTVVDRLAAVEGHIAHTCAACPSTRTPDAGEPCAQPSPLVYRPEFTCFLERCLELAQTHKGLGLAPAVLLLQIVSRLNFDAEPSLRNSFSRYYLHLRVELEAALELHQEALSPQVALALFEAWAAMGALPTNSRAFGLAVRDHLKMGRFTPQELSRLLAAMAALRNARSSYRPCQYDVADVCGGLLASKLENLPAQHLTSVAASLGAYPWPVYQCVVPLLHAVAEEGVHRQACDTMSSPASEALVQAAIASAMRLNRRLGTELEAKVAGWRAQARLATGSNILLRYPAGYQVAAAPKEVPSLL